MTLHLLTGDCRELMRTLELSSVDAVVCDPPYGLTFMGKEWDHGVPGVPFWIEALRVLKPGGYLLAFGGTRTFHRLACAIEDAGFEIRDTLSWLYGSGFPKSLDVSKAIDKAAGAKRGVVGTKRVSRLLPSDVPFGEGLISTQHGKQVLAGDVPITAPATDAARQWEGWGTALKPAMELICMARKPLAESTVAANVLKWGVGGLNIDGCRIDHNGDIERKGTPSKSGLGRNGIYGDSSREQGANSPTRYHATGRWPPNVALDEESAAVLDEMTTDLHTVGSRSTNGSVGVTRFSPGIANPVYPDSGGASRFFYTAKASRSERGDGNQHPTVKPLSLMTWLLKLVAPPGGTVLDPFMGSGSTGVAASREGFNFIGMELDPEYVEIARRRIVGDSPMFTDVEVSA